MIVEQWEVINGERAVTSVCQLIDGKE